MSKMRGAGVAAAVCFVSLSLFVLPVQASPIYAYITGDPIVNEAGDTSTLTVSGFLYGSGTVDVNVAFWDSDEFEDIATDDDEVGSCTASVEVDGAGTFTCSIDVVPSEFMVGNADEEADWVEFYAIVTAEGIESEGYNTGTVLVYCSWCNAAQLGPGPQE